MLKHTFICHTTNQRRNCTRGHAKGKVPSIPHYTTISRRINKLDIRIKDNKSNKEFEDDYLIIAIDSTGIKVTNRGQWIRDKWGVRKGYLKIHIAVDMKSKKILSMKVTEEHVHDSKALPELIQNIIKSNSATASKLFADGAYDSNDVFRCLADNGILPCIKVRKRMLKLDGKKGTSLGIYQFWHKK